MNLIGILTFLEARLVLRLSLKEIEFATQVQILDKAVYFSFCSNALGKDMNPSFIFLAMS